MQNQLTITLLQHDILWHKPQENRRRVARALAEAPASDIIVLPETFTTGFGAGMEQLAEPQEGLTLRWMQELATEHGCLVAGSWIVRDGHRCFNRMHWVFPDGSHGHYDKAHTFRPSGEHEVIDCGREQTVFDYKGWHIRPAVCYDLRFPKWLRNDNLGYDLLLVCANWPASRREAWTTLLKARAIENLCYVAGCNRTGTDGAGGLYSGDSAVIDYKGLPLPADGDIITTTIRKDRLDAFRQRWPFYLDFD